MKKYWISWIQKTEDYRPVSFPPNELILGWWCTGYDSEDNAVLCAAVKADKMSQAHTAIFKDWPEAEKDVAVRGWRIFNEVSDDWIPGDRFPLSDWMKKRFKKEA